jgi:hypothetical protein
MWMMNLILLVCLGVLLWAAFNVARHIKQHRKPEAPVADKR